MKVLYLSEDYHNTTVHHNLCSAIIRQSIDCNISIFTVYRPSKNNIKTFYFDKKIYDVIEAQTSKLRRYKFDFCYKRRFKLKEIERQIDLYTYDLIHAATIFSEGIVAYDIYKKYNIPYIVAVRETDITFYFKYMAHLWYLGIEILNCAKKVIFITNSLKLKFENNFYSRFIHRLNDKSSVISNGIDDFWLNNTFQDSRSNNKILYVGRFDDNKNVKSLIKSVLTLKQDFGDIQLTLVGGGGSQQSDIERLCKENKNVIKYLGKIYDQDKLCSLMRECSTFAMVSHSETFGLVYLEALSQNMKVLYTKGQGIDGTFTQKIGEKVDSHKLNDIVRGLRELLIHTNKYENVLSVINNFNWDVIGEKYYNIYKVCQR